MGMAGTRRVLVAYATAAGSTAGVAERIAGVLRSAGCAVVCRPVGTAPDVTGFDGFVVGSAVHDMAWLPSAVDLLQRVAEAGGGPVWCFSVGAVNPRGPVTRYLARKEAERVAQRFPTGFAPRDHRVFGGIVAMREVPLWGRVVYRLAGARPGDHRDWPAVEAWAGTVAAELTAGPAGSRGTAAAR